MIQDTKIIIELLLSSNFKKVYLKFPYNKELVEIMHSISAIWDPLNKIWSIISKPRNVLYAIQTLGTGIYTLVIPEEIQKIYNKALKLQEEQNKFKIEIEKIKSNTNVNIDFKKFLKIEPFNFQKIGVVFLDAVNGKGLLADSPGLGKSLQSIGYCCYKNFKNILIICPASLKYNWRAEIEKFTDKRAIIPKSGDIIPPLKEWDFIIINYEMLVSRGKKKLTKTIVEQLASFISKNKIDCIIADEAHKMKNKTAKSTKIIHKEFKNIPHKILLSGTPIKSRPIEYFSLLSFIDKERWSNKTEFCNRYCDPKKTQWGMDYSGASNLGELYQETIPYVIRREKHEVLKELPDKTYTKISIELDEKSFKEYQKLKVHLLIRLKK